MQSLRQGVCLGAVLMISGCAGVNVDSLPATTVSMSAITYRVPQDPGIARWGNVENLTFPNGVLRQGPGFFDRLVIRRNSLNNLLEIERREDNGTAGSGKIYRVSYGVQRSSNGYTLTLKPIDYRTYQQGLMLKFPVPAFSEDELRGKILLGARLTYTFEVTSRYAPEVVYSHFTRRLQRSSYGEPEGAGATKTFRNTFGMVYQGVMLQIGVQVQPYRDGSVTTMRLVVPAIETAPNTVDFVNIINGIKADLTKIVNG